MSMEAGVEKMRMATVGQAYELPYRLAATEKLRRETELLGRPEAGERFETFVGPDGRWVKRDLVTGEETQVTGLPPTPAVSFEEKAALRRIPTDIPRGDYWRDTDTGDIQWVDYGTEPPAGYTQRVPSREVQVSDLPGRRFELTKDKAIRDSAVRIRMNLKNPAVKGEIEFINQNSNSTTGFIWLETAKRFWPDAKETIEVKLPRNKEGKQLTMEDIRRVAKDNELTVEDVLRRVHDSMSSFQE